MSRFSRQNNGINFILVCIDTYSRYVWLYTLKTKTVHEVSRKLDKCFTFIRKHFKNNFIAFTTDTVNEFNYTDLYKKFDITRYINDNSKNLGHPGKTALVERFNATLWSFIKKYTHYNNSLAFVHELDKFEHNYNNRTHSSTKQTPSDVFNQKASPEAPKYEKIDHEYILGDTVRLVNKSKVFDKKSFIVKNSRDIYVVIGFSGNRIIVKNDAGDEKSLLPREVLKVSYDVSAIVDAGDIVKENSKINSVSRKLKADGIDKSNIVERPKRVRKAVERTPIRVFS